MSSSIRLGKFSFVQLVAGMLIALVAAGSAHSDESERWAKLAYPMFQHYTRDNGLADPVATSVAQDGDGFLWVGTYGGLDRWDGYRFRNYRSNPKDPGALPDNLIVALHTDPLGRLWIGTSGGGLARYDRDHDRFVTYAAGTGGLSHALVGAMVDDGAGGLWIATGDGLDHLDSQTGELTWQRHDDKDPDSLPARRVLSVLRDHTGTIWVGTRAGLARRDPATGRFVTVPLAASPGPVLAVKTLFEDDLGRLWIGTVQGGAYVLDGTGGPARPVDEIDGRGSTGRSDFITAISAGIGGEIWLGTNGQGIVAVDPATGRSRRVRHDPSLPGSLISDSIWKLFRDRAGTMWIATVGGLDRLTNGDTAVLTLLGGSGRESSLASSNINTLLATSDGRIWLGLLQGGVAIIDPTGAQVASLRPDPRRPKTALPQAPVLSLEEIDGAVFVGTIGGLYRTDLAGAIVQPVTLPKCEASVSAGELLAAADSLWIGGQGRGVCQMSIRGGALSLVGRWDDDRLTDGRVVTIERGAADDVWIGTRNGLNRLDLVTGAVERIPPNPSDPAALAAGFVTSLLVDSRARLWISTQGGGIQVLTHRDAAGRPRFRRIGTAEGLLNTNAGALLQDTQGKIWASTSDGLAVVDPETFVVRGLHRADGVALAHFGDSGARTPEGELLFSGADGLTVVRPERLKEWGYRPPVVVTDARIGGLPVLIARFNGAGSAEPLVITPKANSLAVEFSALDYTDPARNRYAYKLEGFDTNWIETDPTRRLAAYTNLPPGKYALRVRGSNRDGVWTEKTLELPIQVLPGWYQTLWFKLALFGAGIAAVAVLVQARTALLRQRQRELQGQVEARTAEVVHQKAVVEEQKAVVELRNVEVERQRAVAEQAHRNISLLSEIGRQITASLDPEAIMNTLYLRIDKLMDVSVFAIGLYRADRELIEFSFAMELGKRYAPYTLSMNEPNQLAAWCIRHQQEVFINDFAGECGRYTDSPECTADLSSRPLEDGTRSAQALAMIYAPLLVKDRVLGVISVQSFERGVYAPVHLDMLRTLASYAAVALDNADAYRELGDTLLELQQTQAKLVQQEKLASLGQLVAGVAHEVNTPLGVALAASTQIADEVGRLDGVIASGQLRRTNLTDFMATLHELSELLARNCARASSLIQSFKAVAADRGSDERRRFDLRAYVEDVSKSVEPTLHRSNVKLLIEKGIEGAAPLTIDSYPGALSQVIINLVTNALTHAFAPEQAGVITIQIALRDAAHAELTVRDDGQGIPPDVLPKIFDPFFTTRRGVGGTGLGLHIVHNLVTGPLGGSISVETATASGTAFIIVLPLNAPSEPI